MSHLIDPNAPSDLPLAPSTPRWRKRRLGVAAMAVLFGLLGYGAWHYKFRTPPSDSGSPGVFQRR